MIRNSAPLAVLVLAATQTAVSAQTVVNVRSLMEEGYTVAGVLTSPAGQGVFLQKGQALMVCFVAEKPGASSVDTQYCKPVK
jgi:hypothetical protein